jgi:two-component system, OmpR family, phosphate regulon sensor histidine kinase PhoR
MTGKIFVKLLAGILCLLLIALVTVDYFATDVSKDNYIQSLTGQLEDKGRMLAISLGNPDKLDPAAIRKMSVAAGGRITVVRSDGKVLVDSEADAASMENHRNRPELQRAFQSGTGSDIRQSATIGVSFLYVAVPMDEGRSAIRIAFPLAEINRQVDRIRTKILVSTVLAFLPAILIAAALARSISQRFATIMAHAGELARGNFRSRLPASSSSEFGQLAQTLNVTAENLQKTVAQLQFEHTELEKLERVRKDFVINVSHELRTPLASIQGYTETLIDGAISDPAYNMRFLTIIRHNAERLARLTEDLHTLSRVEQKRQKFEFYIHEVNTLIHDASDLMRPLAEKAKIQLIEEPAPDGAMVYCDSEAVSQILSNLMENAIKYTPAGGRISVGAVEQGSMVEFFVRDTGIGIPEEELPRLFERFYRVDKARSRELGGTGLGLSIVKHLVAAQKGEIRVESQVQQGTTFAFTLPVNPPPEE